MLTPSFAIKNAPKGCVFYVTSDISEGIIFYFITIL